MQKQILLADNDPAVRRMLCRILAEEKYSVIAVDNPEDVAAIFKRTAIDLVLLDLNLGKSGASDWASFQQFTKHRPSVPFILIASQSDEDHFTLDPRSGAVMEKPLDLVELLRTIELLLQDGIAA